MNGHYCLGCGCFFWVSKDIQPVCCPDCHDQFISNGVQETVPAPIGERYIVQNSLCGHTIETELPGDVNWCAICGIAFTEKHKNLPTIKKHQLSILRGIGMR